MGEATPICRCRVLYLGSAVPRQSKDGLQGIQEPLRNLYPSEGAIGARGIDSWLSVWSNGILLENVDENRKQVTRFFPIESLHYCAAVRQVLIPERGNTNPEPKFLPLDSPFARMPKAQHPPIFAAILRRTTGIKVLECHVFICKREAAANALVRCCFHAYADNSYASQLEGGNSSGSVYGTLGGNNNNNNNSHHNSNNNHNNISNSNGHSSNHHHHNNNNNHHKSNGDLGRLRSTESTTSINHLPFLNGIEVNGGTNSVVGSNGSAAEGYTSIKNLYASSGDLVVLDDVEGSIYNGEENHKIWNGSNDNIDTVGTENPYEIFSGGESTLGRPARARQISTPIPVPPPPIKEETKKKSNKKSSKHSGSQSLSGTLIRPKPVHLDSLQRPRIHHPSSSASMIYGPINSQASRQFHTFSHHRPGLIPAPNIGISSGRHHPHHHHHHHGPPPPHLMHPSIPMHIQMPVMLPHQYATLQSGRNSKRSKHDKMNGIPVGMPTPPPAFFAYPPPQPPQIISGHHQPIMSPPEPRPLSMYNRKLTQSVGGGLDDSGNSGAESPGGTGIYRRKGHLNERAFSYSIRQEHRSRSHGSLASLQFSSPADIKKEQEIAQIMAGLELNDDNINRSTHQYSRGSPLGTFGQFRRKI